MTEEERLAKEAADKAAAEKAAAEAAKNGGQGNEEHKFRRLFEDSETKRKEQETRLAELEAAENKRKEAEMTEAQREKARADAAEAKAKKLETDALKGKIAGELKLPAEAIEFLPDGDEATIRTRAEALAKFATAPVQGGSQTNPGRQQQATLDEQISAAEKAGNRGLSLQLKLQRMDSGE